LIVLAGVDTVYTKQTFRISEKVLENVGRMHGGDSVDRLLQWQELIHRNDSSNNHEKLEKVNSFFNGLIEFVDDIELYGVRDYWATPIEFLARGAGDCEDFAIAKFFTLKMMGVKEDKLNITYVKALSYNIHHMVLTYYEEPGAEPLVLDNLVDSIEPAGNRPDLLPIFSFNGTGLWLAKERGRGKSAGSSSRLKAWRDLLQRMAKDGLQN
jgi:predicted transglutaminase-like cysteine proteinase